MFPMYISIKRHSWFFKSWWCLLYFGHVQTRTAGKCWRKKTPFCLKLSTHAQWRQKTPFCLKLSTHAQKSVLSWSIGDPGMTSYRWPDFGAVDNKPRKRQQTIQHSAMVYGLSWTAFIIMCIIAVVASIDIWVWSWCRTCIKESFTKLVWQIKSRNCWRWAGQMSVSASGWSVHWEWDWEQPTEWPNLTWHLTSVPVVSTVYYESGHWLRPKMFDRRIKLTRVV